MLDFYKRVGCAPMPVVIANYFHYRRMGWRPHMAWGFAVTRSGKKRSKK